MEATSNEIKASTAGYGPDDFVVETVNLDKNFFYQFFTSKPMIIDTDVVTSTSVQVNYDQKFKRGRETSDDIPNKKGRETENPGINVIDRFLPIPRSSPF